MTPIAPNSSAASLVARYTAVETKTRAIAASSKSGRLRSATLDEIDSKDLHIYPITRSSLSFRWHLLHQVGKPLTNAARIFVDTIVNDLDVKRQRWQMLVSK